MLESDTVQHTLCTNASPVLYFCRLVGTLIVLAAVCMWMLYPAWVVVGVSVTVRGCVCVR